MRDWLRTGTGSPPVPVRRDHLTSTAAGQAAAASAAGPSAGRLLGLRAHIPAVLVGTNTLVLLTAAAALTWVPTSLPETGPGRSAAPAPAAAPTAPTVPVTLARPAVAEGDPEAAPPRRVGIERIGVDSGLVGLRVQRDGQLEVPADYGVVGWHRAGTAPGDRGPAVLVGHVDSFEGPAVFYRLRELAPGDRVTVSRTDGSVVAFDVYGVERYAKQDFPTDAVYGDTADPELRLVTCGGEFDEKTRSYQDNVVVYARQAPPPPPPAGPPPGPPPSGPQS